MTDWGAKVSFTQAIEAYMKLNKQIKSLLKLKELSTWYFFYFFSIFLFFLIFSIYVNFEWRKVNKLKVKLNLKGNDKIKAIS